MNCEFGHLSRYGASSPYRRIDRKCDLPAEPNLKAWRALCMPSWRVVRGCIWVPKYPDTRRHGMPSPPKSFRDHVWSNPVRTREREYRQKALKEYRGTGEVESILPDETHHHNAKWLWW